ncbi:MAG: polysaccharide deacetylase family protein [Clostridia bacterium]|nr:polysaccharide deacetylase family protein [Clostridia bacterium]
MRRLIISLILISLILLPLRADEQMADVYFSYENEDKRIALTFDDSPHYKYTAEILDILDEYNIKATFFVVGQLAEKYPELILRELAEGHEVASHTWSHAHLTMLSDKSLEDEIYATEELLYELAEYRPTLLRPPEGKYGDNLLRVAGKLDYEVILWTVDTRDWAHTPTETIVNTVLENTESGSIILCHDFIGGESPTPAALREFIPKLIENGYEFVTVSDLIFSAE